MKTNYYNPLNRMNDSEKIMYIVEKVFKATSPETAVSMEQIIEKGIEMGIAETYPRGKEDGHPWYPHTSVMMGVGSANAVENWEEPYLHRRKMHKTTGGVCMCYWVDKTKVHEIVRRSEQADGLKQAVKSTYEEFPAVRVTLSLAEKIAKMEANPGKFRLIGEKLVSEAWINANPEKFKVMYENS